MLRYPSMAVLVATLTGCAFGSGSGTRGHVFYPAPPDTARLQFLTSISGERDLGRSRSVFEFLVGAGSPEGAGALAVPFGMAVFGNKGYVCDQQHGRLAVLDFAARDMTFFQPSGSAALRQPVNASVDGEGRLYVADLGRRDVVIFDSTGAFSGAVELGAGARPADVAVAHGRIWISDLGARAIRVFDQASLEPLFAFPARGADAAERLASPANLAVSDSAVYVSDVLKSTVQVFALDGTYVRTIAGPGDGPGHVARPKGIALDRAGRLYVVDALYGHVQIFDDQDRVLLVFGGKGGAPGAMALPVKVVVDYENTSFFQEFVADPHGLEYVVYVTNQAGEHAINVYGFLSGRQR